MKDKNVILIISHHVVINSSPLLKNWPSFHSKNVVSTTRPLELLLLDLFGLTKTASLGGKKYGLVIMDDFSIFTWVIFLIHKDETCEAFKIFSKRIQDKKRLLNYFHQIRSWW